jgi:hypothetical protein
VPSAGRELAIEQRLQLLIRRPLRLGLREVNAGFGSQGAKIGQCCEAIHSLPLIRDKGLSAIKGIGYISQPLDQIAWVGVSHKFSAYL